MLILIYTHNLSLDLIKHKQKTMKKNIVMSILAIITISFATAQDYKTGIGVRGGFYNGVTIKHFTSEKVSLEAIISSRWRGFNVTGLYEINNKTSIDRLNWYFGAGAHIGFWNGSNVKWANDNRDYTVIGVDAILGLEYNFKQIPFNLSIDWKPAMNLFGYNGFWGDGGAFSFRYIF